MTDLMLALLAGDDPSYNVQLHALLSEEPGLVVIDEVDNADDIEAAAQAHALALVVLAFMQPLPVLLDIVARTQACCPDVPLVLVGARDDFDFKPLVAAGVDALILRADPLETVLNAVRAALLRGTWISPAITAKLAESQAEAEALRLTLTDREQALLDLIADGLDNRAIAATLGLAPQTVRNSVSRLYARLDVRTRAEAVILARERGFGRGAKPT